MLFMISLTNNIGQKMNEPKITKQDVLNASSEMLNKDLYVVFTKPTNGMIPVMENLEEHLKFQVSLKKKE